MAALFGTDGVRGRANEFLTPELAIALARATASLFVPPGGRVIIGRDSRTSGPMLEASLAAGFSSSGVDVALAGVIPTPAISFLLKDERAQLGAVISASHNPPEDNGIKFFNRAGLKLTIEEEEAIEHRLSSPSRATTPIGSILPVDAAATRYAAFLTGTIESEDIDLSGLLIVVDCAYGATGRIAPHVLRHLGAGVIELHTEHDGSRINQNCGSTHLDAVRGAVLAHRADLGIAFDGDGDRVLLVTSRGRTIDGDQAIGIAALHWMRRGAFDPPLVVTTVLSNYGLERILAEHGIEMVRTPVGDRNVARTMVERGAKIGGEQSGHIIFSDHALTGDGILTAVKLLEIAHESSSTLEALADEIPLYPQAYTNLPCTQPAVVAESEAAAEAIDAAVRSLGSRGRVIVRPSGTQPFLRIMVEAGDEALARTVCDGLANRLGDCSERCS